MPEIVAVIPAKSTSNRIRNKNLAEMNGQPLYRWALDACLESGAFSQVYVSSDYPFSGESGFTPHRRDQTQLDGPSCDCLHYVMDEFYSKPILRPDWFCLVQPTSPCLRADTLALAASLCAEDVDLIVATRAGDPKPCGAFYFIRAHRVERMASMATEIELAGDRLLWYPITSEEAIDVDCHADWHMAELVLEERDRETV